MYHTNEENHTALRAKPKSEAGWLYVKFSDKPGGHQIKNEVHISIESMF